MLFSNCFFILISMNLSKNIQIAVFYFLLVSLMGVLLRFFFVVPIPLNYKFILHAHSHTALLGWIYIGLTTLIYRVFLNDAANPKLAKRVFIFTHVCILGMLFTFPFQGYALYSIIFSTLFLFASYWFSWFAIKFVSPSLKSRMSWKFAKAALIYLVVSSIGPWAIGGVMATLGTESIWYKTSIYFYLHFQYNGWFMMALLSILLYIFEENKINFNIAKVSAAFTLLNYGIILSLFLSVLWFKPPIIFYVIGGIGAVLQLVAFIQIFKIFRPELKTIQNIFDHQSLSLLKIAGSLLIIKIVLQIFSGLPFVANLAVDFKDFVIGYLHIVFLGIVIPTMLTFLIYFKLIKVSNTFILLFFIAFFTTESLIFYKAIALWLHLPFLSSYYILLAVLSSIFPIAIGNLFYKNIRPSN